jgi:hypothetical protein
VALIGTRSFFGPCLAGSAALAAVITAMITAMATAGCAAKPEPVRRAAPAEAPLSGQSSAPWQSFDGTAAVLRKDIDRRAEALRSGPIGNRAAELASLRLAASAHELLDAGSVDGARHALERAVSLYAGNGYACLLLAYVHHAQGRPVDAREQLARARRTLPKDERVRSELDALSRSMLRAGT